MCRQLAVLPLSAVAMSMTIAPRIEIYTLLACSVHKPDIFERTLRLGGYRGFPTETSPLLVLPPVIIPNSLDPSNLGFSPSVPVSGVHGFSYATSQANPCASDPVVQAAVATLTAGEFGTCAFGHNTLLLYPKKPTFRWRGLFFWPQNLAVLKLIHRD